VCGFVCNISRSVGVDSRHGGESLVEGTGPVD